MATGDAAVAAGMAVVAASDDRRNGFDEINKTRDYLATHQSGTHHDGRYYTKAQVNTSLDGKADKNALAPRAVGNLGSNHIGFEWSDSEVVAQIDATRIPLAKKSDLGGYAASNHNHNGTYAAFSGSQLTFRWDGGLNVSVAGGGWQAVGGGSTTIVTGEANAISTAALGRTVTHRSLWAGADRLIGVNTSSERYKEDITPVEVDVASVLALEPVTYHRIGVADPQREMGLIAESVPEALAPYLVIYDVERDAGGNPVSEELRPDGVRYETVLPTLLLAALKAQQTQIDTLTARLDAKEGE